MSVSIQTRRVRGSARRFGSISREPEVALLVTTYQKPWHLRRVLTSVALQEGGVRDRMEMVVADDGSTDETSEIVRQFADTARFPVSFTTHPHETFQAARCRNEGVAASKAPYLLFLDGDCMLPPDHIFQHLKHRRANHVMGGYCCRLNEDISSRFDDASIRSGEYFAWIPRSELWSLAKIDLKARFYHSIRHPRKPRLRSGNVGMWRHDYERVNGYDENFTGWGGEDDDFGYRLRRGGVRMASILRWTRTYHLWHPRDVTAPVRGRDGKNIPYLNRDCRLTRCINGLHKRSVDDLLIRVVGTPSRPEAAAAILGSRKTCSDPRERVEVELLFLPGKGRFSGRADCNVLIVLEDLPVARRLAKKAHFIVSDHAAPYPGKPHPFRLRQFDQVWETIIHEAPPNRQAGRAASSRRSVIHP